MLFVDPSRDGAKRDEVTILSMWTGFSAQLPDKYAIHEFEIAPIVHGMRTDFPYENGEFEKASPFKKAANFTCYWVAASPIVRYQATPTRIPDSEINATFAFTVSMRSLHGAKLLGRVGEQPRVLSNPIELSEHSYLDIIDALRVITPRDSFNLVSVLYEQLAYKSNPDCQYETHPIV